MHGRSAVYVVKIWVWLHRTESRAELMSAKKKRENGKTKRRQTYSGSYWAEAALTFCERVDAVGVVVGAYDPVGNAEVERIVGREVGQCVLFFQRRKIRSSYILLSTPFIFIKQQYGRATAGGDGTPDRRTRLTALRCEGCDAQTGADACK